jgi:hypothetical protein
MASFSSGRDEGKFSKKKGKKKEATIIVAPGSYDPWHSIRLIKCHG